MRRVMRSRRYSRVMRAWIALLLLAACGPDPANVTTDAPVGGAADAARLDDGAPAPDARIYPDAGPPPFFGRVYAHSSNDLYEVDPDTLDVTYVGPFTMVGAGGPVVDIITDIALDKNANMTGVSYEHVYSIDKTNGECTWLATLDRQFNGLSWVPVEELDDTGAEVLIGAALDGSVWQIDPVTGASTQIGEYGGGWGSSGDIVSVAGFGTVATVNQGDGFADHLAVIDLEAGAVATVSPDPIGFNQVFGLGFWEGQVFGFTENRQFILIDPATGIGTLVEDSVPFWWGAGVTTEAPIIE